MAHGDLPTDVAYLLVTYLWEGSAGLEDLPTYEFDAKEILAPYIGRIGATPDAHIDPQVFEMVVATWLRDLTYGNASLHSGLDTTGLFAFLKGGRVVSQAAA